MAVSPYTHPAFVPFLNMDTTDVVCDVGANDGANDGATTIDLARAFHRAPIAAFECGGDVVPRCRENLCALTPRVTLYPVGLGDTAGQFDFHVWDDDKISSLHDVCSYVRGRNPARVESIDVRRLDTMFPQNTRIHLLCLDVQGFELAVLRGCGQLLKNVTNIIMEQPKRIPPGLPWLPKGCHSKYKGAPTYQDVRNFMQASGFREIVVVRENHIEDNALWRRRIEYHSPANLM